MTQQNTDRASAHAINPLISDINSLGTLEDVSAMLLDIGHVSATTECAAMVSWFCEMAAAALTYEIIQQRKREATAT